ncbi:MAG: sigma-54-dependent Fis family transcriptional regulator, partial [Planctomycetes bacterium]|nr:sigma-54-dependent Fis family transcriptional regulator [Planctomycetota bacterium]
LTWVSDEFRATVETVQKAARTDASVLILGPSGTGKELLAHFLHDSSRRSERPFVPIDCATMPENLIESELFGHVKGAFSGAESNKMGLFQVADGGTLFLDEVGELPLPFQTKLLRAIQERKIRRVGGNEIIEVDVRIVAATNRDLQSGVDAGRFRPDLFYRLDVVRIDVPPLAARRADIRPLAETFLEEFRAHNPNCVVERFAPDAIATMESFDWPGNVRQLRNIVERVCALCSAPEVMAADLPKGLGVDEAESPRGAEPFQEMKARKIAAIESSYLVGLLREHAGNVTRCAKEAGMSRSAFQKIMQRYGIRSSDYRPE